MSVAEDVAAYIEKRPYIQEALKEDIINYSALARRIGDNIDGSFEAIKIALRRLQQDITAQRQQLLDDIGSVLQETAIELQNKVKVCKSAEEQDGDLFAKTDSGYTYIQQQSDTCTGEEISGQVLITLRSPINLETTAGVVSFILQSLEGRDINVTELISCREDTHLVIDEDDATQAFDLLSEKLS